MEALTAEQFTIKKRPRRVNIHTSFHMRGLMNRDGLDLSTLPRYALSVLDIFKPR